MGMLGAIIGDIVGSRFEWDNIKSKDFEFLHGDCFPTDDTLMTLAVGKAICESAANKTDLAKEAVFWMQSVGRVYNADDKDKVERDKLSFGSRFYYWLFEDEPKPYYSFGNGAAMRVSPCGLAAKDINDAIRLSQAVTGVTHNHPEGMKGAEATAVVVHMAKSGVKMSEIRKYVEDHYYPLDFTIDGIRDTYQFNGSCQGSVPQSIEAFLESTSYEDAVRNAISIGGDSDTLGAITGGMAEAYWGIPDEIKMKGVSHLDELERELLRSWLVFTGQEEASLGENDLFVPW